MTPKNIFAGLEPAALWACFSRITEIPRPSGQESAIAEWLANWASTQGFLSRRDTAGNICVYVPASMDSLASRTVALQAHLDMVCVRSDDSTSDPAAGSIRILREGDWIVAPSSTLGADNGIGIAAAMCLAESKATPHGPLELLFTVEEETTFKGADELDPSLIQANVMLNLDHETAGELCVGCAGATWTILRWPAPAQPSPEGWLVVDIVLSGLSGGHSGKDIHKNQLNAIKGMVWLVRRLAKDVPFRLCALEGGDAVNAIPIWAHATISFPPTEAHSFKAALADARSRLASRFSLTDPGLSLSTANIDLQGIKCWSDESRDRLLDLLTAVPSGVVAMEQHAPDMVETSNNLGIVALRDDVVEVHCLSRSSVADAQEETVASIESVAQLAGAEFAIVPPVIGPWRLPSDSALLAIVQATYQDLFRRAPILATIHAGVECGTIQQRIPGLDVLSLGPEIHYLHRPGERVNIPSVVEFYALLCEVVRRLAA
ncbi:MAG: beta-Ala-His dipeptidase [Anaerolineales bacterium]|nr:beta-Ala-His dipeptidase [Anaerolineales bacterium]